MPCGEVMKLITITSGFFRVWQWWSFLAEWKSSRAVVCLLLAGGHSWAVALTGVNSFTAGSPISASLMNQNFGAIATAFSGTVSSPWSTTGSNIYYTPGYVGIGTTGYASVAFGAYVNSLSSPLMIGNSRSTNTFAVLPWDDGTYVSSGIYYASGVWMASFSSGALFHFGSGGASWFAFTGSSAGAAAPSFNAANSVPLWSSAGILVSSSSRKIKGASKRLDKSSILASIRRLDIEEWGYLSDLSVRHIGPYAEDFYREFRVGELKEHIALLDEVGVALAGVQALDEKVMEFQVARDAEHKAKIELLQAQAVRIAEHEAKIESLQSQVEHVKEYEVKIEALMKRLSALEQ